MKKLLTLMFAALMSMCLAAAHADEIKKDEGAMEKDEGAMKMDEPMPTEMARQGMMKGDVKKAAKEKAKEMEPMLEQEEKTMPQSPPQ